MDLIYTNKERVDEGVLLDYSFDLAFGSGENDFELTVSTANHVCKDGYAIYIEGTEYGGLIDTIKVDTVKKNIIYKGRTWHGILGSKIIEPDSGEDYYTISGEANKAIGIVIDRLGLTDLFKASTVNSGVTISNYKFARYIDGYSGIMKMLKSKELKLKIIFMDAYAVLSAVPIVDYSQDEEFESDQIEFVIEKNYKPINHLICLGQGELKDRAVVHLYADKEGNISDTQSLFGLDEVTDVYENVNEETTEALKEAGIERFKNLIKNDTLDIDLNETAREYDIGDIVGATELTTGITVTKSIVKKIISITKDKITIQHKVGG